MIAGFTFPNRSAAETEDIMCTFDAPISRCELMREMVITDQSQKQCACEHNCPADTRCPLADVFTGVDFSPGVMPKAAAPPRLRMAA